MADPYSKTFLMPEWELATRNDVENLGFSHIEKDADGEDVEWYTVRYKTGEPTAAELPKAKQLIWPWLAGGSALLLIIVLVFIFRKRKK